MIASLPYHGSTHTDALHPWMSSIIRGILGCHSVVRSLDSDGEALNSAWGPKRVRAASKSSSEPTESRVCDTDESSSSKPAR
eukprot:758188-Hanusia_phi.AAC.1